MIYSESNNLGDISINKGALNDVIALSIKPWSYTGKIKMLQEKKVKVTDKGVYICLHFSVALGESLNEIFKKVTEYIEHELINSLELDIDDIVICVDTMFTAKGNVVKRDIKYSLNGTKD